VQGYDIVILERLDQLFGGVFSITKPFTGSNEDIALGALIKKRNGRCLK
jgi:hypothetical protein